MSLDEIVVRITSYVSQAQTGFEIESPKVDFKREWYDINQPKSLMEFIKDTSAIANTFGPDGFIIIGYDDKKKTFHNCSFSHSGLKDTSSITDIINKHVERLFSINYYEAEIIGHKLGILHIPPSIDKPHVIRLYKTFKGENQIPHEHRIFIRKGTGTFPASKYDLDLMYYDKKNIQPDYELYASSSVLNILFFEPASINYDKVPISFNITINMENTGRRPVSITSFKFILSVYSDPADNELYAFLGHDKGFYSTIIQSGEMKSINAAFNTSQTYTKEERGNIVKLLKYNFHSLGINTLIATLSNGDKITCKLTLTRFN